MDQETLSLTSQFISLMREALGPYLDPPICAWCGATEDVERRPGVAGVSCAACAIHLRRES